MHWQAIKSFKFEGEVLAQAIVSARLILRRTLNKGIFTGSPNGFTACWPKSPTPGVFGFAAHLKDVSTCLMN